LRAGGREFIEGWWSSEKGFEREGTREIFPGVLGPFHNGIVRCERGRSDVGRGAAGEVSRLGIRLEVRDAAFGRLSWAGRARIARCEFARTRQLTAQNSTREGGR
jgi:hypothetical protein